MVSSDVRARPLAGSLCAGVLIVASFATTANAGVVPNLTFHVQETTTGFNQMYNPAGAAGPLFYNYGIGINESAFAINGSINASPDLPSVSNPSPALLSTTLSFTNNHTDTLNFIVTMTLPMTTGNTAVNWNTSASWVLTGPSSGAQLETIPGMPLWAVFIDNSPIATLFDHESNMGGSGSGPYDLSTDPKMGAFGPVTQSIAIQLAFSITPGATGGPTGAFTLVPAPGALALFAGLFVGASRRRRE